MMKLFDNGPLSPYLHISVKVGMLSAGVSFLCIRRAAPRRKIRSPEAPADEKRYPTTREKMGRMREQARRIVIGVMILLCLGFYGDALSASKGGRIMKIASSAFNEGQKIPSKYTCDGQDVSPPLEWDSLPDGTESFSLICDDPDAPRGTWVHWVVYDIPPHMKNLAENVPPDRELGSGIRQGKNDWLKIGYGGPCPPSGTHRYYFKLYALDTKLNLKPGLTKEQLLQAMKGHVLAEAQLMGKYQRQR